MFSVDGTHFHHPQIRGIYSGVLFDKFLELLVLSVGKWFFADLDIVRWFFL
jgi:hypothetical protein